jgi:hypothetical protein
MTETDPKGGKIDFLNNTHGKIILKATGSPACFVKIWYIPYSRGFLHFGLSYPESNLACEATS